MADRCQSPYTINFRDLAVFVSFSLIASPPNYVWQTWLEATFPGYSGSLSSLEKEKLVDEVVTGHSTVGSARDVKKLAMTDKSVAGRSPAEVKKKLNIQNTAIKFMLDQTFGAAANTILFIVGIALLQGRSFDQGIQECKDGFWPLIRASQRLWPFVSIINLVFVPVERRMIFGSIVGVFWGIFLSFLSSGKTKAS